MNRQEHLLTILGEECSELHQELCKALRFGINEQRDLSTSNAERIFKEFNDLLAMVDMVNESVISTSKGITYTDKGIMYRDESFIEKKKKKVEEYLLYSKECGTLDN
ncbi:MAG TPA: hypothetical protein VIQ81_03965 [Gammaproteobacteria bacterium]